MRSFLAAASLVAVAVAGDSLPIGSAASGSEYPTETYPASTGYETSSEYYATSAAYYASSSPYYGKPYSYVTETYDTYTTYCSEATTLTYGEQKYTAYSAGPITITSCTITKPVYTSMATECKSSSEAAAPYPTSSPCPTSAAAAAAVATASGTMPHYASYTGGANKVVGSGMGVAAIMAVAAFL